MWKGRNRRGHELDLTGLYGSAEAKRAVTALAVRMGLCDLGPCVLDPEDYLKADDGSRS